ncbi:MAG: UDP-N-acetylmuramoyl-L-alanyl-D-glutamate--2,6-diaminopimelate ligase [Phycisphaerae bacterium]|nr:UDP-N-acetylmuramoyl-L-alanyl-D-glutamate--2,6-diaminopimelate ligase [Phycisphaerae bacterium]
MKLLDLIQSLPLSRESGSLDAQITAVVDDSRLAVPGSLFVARPGRAGDGLDYVSAAVERGAVAVLAPRAVSVPRGVALLLSPSVQKTALALARCLHDDPARHLDLVGVTGTNGKTTTTFMIRHLLQEAGRQCGLIGTIIVDDGRDQRPARLTTPGALETTALLAEMHRNGCAAAVMEVSSHALDQGRCDGLDFRAAVFTNLSGDHLDYHGTMDAYLEAKARLFKGLSADSVAVVNADDPAAPAILDGCPARVIHFGQGPGADWQARILDMDAEGTRCRFAGPATAFEARLPLIGRYNVDNMLAALAAAEAVGCTDAEFAQAVATCPPIPGRLEAIRPKAGDVPFSVLVDYAHTDDALKNVLTCLRPLTEGRLRVLFGCGGDRDAAKRPRMGAVAADLADDVVVTSDNPRGEDPRAIIQQILAGAAAGPKIQVEVDRAEAIDRIIADAGDGDVVLLAGKGHEDYQIVGDERRPLDDRELARAALSRRAGSA